MKKTLLIIGAAVLLIGALLFVTMDGDFLKDNILDRSSGAPGVQKQMTGVPKPEKNPVVQKPGNVGELPKPDKAGEIEKPERLVEIKTPLKGPEAQKPSNPPETPKPAKVPAGQEGGFVAKGIVESEEKIDIGSQVSGLITKVLAGEGDRVRKGQTLVILDSDKALTRVRLQEAAVKEARARLKELEAGYRSEDIEMAQSRVKRVEAILRNATDEHERQKRLFGRGATTLVEVERAEEKARVAMAEVNEARAQLKKLQRGVRKEEVEQAKAAVEKTTEELNYYRRVVQDYTILAPMDGLVTERFKDAHETVGVGTPILRMINPGKLRVRAELEETDVGRVQEGQPAEVSMDALKEKVYHGKVYKVFPVIKRKALRTFDPSQAMDISTQGIYVRLEDFSGLKVGLSVTVRFLQ
jgi:multidrug resistance efflux pump